MLHKVSWVAESRSSLIWFIYCWSEPVVSISAYNLLMEGLVSTVAWLVTPCMISPFSGVVWESPVFMFSHLIPTLFHSSASGLFYEPMKISAAFSTWRKMSAAKTLYFLDQRPSSNIIQPKNWSFAPVYTYLQGVSSFLRSGKEMLVQYVSIVHLYLSSSMYLWSFSWSSPGVPLFPTSKLLASSVQSQSSYPIMPIIECRFQWLFLARNKRCMFRVLPNNASSWSISCFCEIKHSIVHYGCEH